MQPGGIGPNERSRLAVVGQAVGIGFAIAAALVLPILVGLFADSRTGRGPVFTLVGLAVGLAAAGWELVRLGRSSAALPEQPDTVSPEERARRMAEWDADHESERDRRERLGRGDEE